MAAFIPDTGFAAAIPAGTAAVIQVAADSQERVPAAIAAEVGSAAVADLAAASTAVGD
jgi:hypothetical protein